MEIVEQERLVIVERSQVSAARAAARRLAHAAGMSETDAHRAGTVATELGTNLLKHAQGGELLVGPAVDAAGGLDLLAIDRGPGIGNIARALSDGYSSAGSAGTGLGAIGRMSEVFDLHTRIDKGTVVFARLRAGRAAPAAFLVGAVSIAKAGETACGDAYHVSSTDDELTLTVADGLGHGPGAREAALSIIGAAGDPSGTTVGGLLERMHAASRHTRGAAAAVARVQRRATTMTFAGVGNVAGAVCQGETQRSAVSGNGTLGHTMHAVREFQYPWSRGALLVMHTDGLTSHWSLQEYPGLVARHPAVVAAVLYRDFSRQRDDVTVVVAREAE
jgi:anti-sigma regulatory factor (Ser/Thr protein kinase)